MLFRSVVEEIVRRHSTGQPVLVGTVSIENSERISDLLKKKGVSHQVLNAKYHAEEDAIISNAGQYGTVTIATNMAGRGTDIHLGEGVAEVGGLHIMGTERHESRRIDNQLRGRAGRQGDQGSSQFYLSMEDELMRRFGADNIMGMMERLGFDEDSPIESRLISRAIESAQKRVEGNNFDTRRIVLQYDDVINLQREKIYGDRRAILNSENIRDIITGMIRSVINRAVDTHCSDNDVPEDWDMDSLVTYAHTHFLPEDRLTKDDLWGKEKEEIVEFLAEGVEKLYDEREESIGIDTMREFEKVVVLRAVDSKWMDHIDSMDHLRQGIHLRAYGGNDPLREYQFEGHNMFLSMIERIEEEITMYIMRAQVQTTPKREAVAEGQAVDSKAEEGPKKPKTRSANAVGRNDPCPCGSGKKYKLCHGRID